jgi:hypothetical protein
VSDRDQVLAELAKLGLGDLLYSLNPGCAGARYPADSSPSQCPAHPTHSVVHAYRYPRVHRVRLLVCEQHARLGEDPQPITPTQQANLDARLAWHRAAWENRLIARQ